MANGFVATPICCPSRTETFTGRHLHNLFGGTACMHADTSQAGSRVTGLFGRLTDLGYETGACSLSRTLDLTATLEHPLVVRAVLIVILFLSCFLVSSLFTFLGDFVSDPYVIAPSEHTISPSNVFIQDCSMWLTHSPSSNVLCTVCSKVCLARSPTTRVRF
jgi:hypothetical protein